MAISVIVCFCVTLRDIALAFLHKVQTVLVLKLRTDFRACRLSGGTADRFLAGRKVHSSSGEPVSCPNRNSTSASRLNVSVYWAWPGLLAIEESWLQAPFLLARDAS